MNDDIKQQDRGEYFASLVSKAIANSDRYKRSSIAKGIGMSYPSLDNRLHARTPFSADEIRRLIAFFPDPSLVSYLLRGTAFIAAERIEAGITEEEEAIFKAAHRIVLEASDVLRAVDEALLDRRIDHRDAAKICEEVEDAERGLISLRDYISKKR